MRKIVVLSLAAAALAVSACNTISGIGRDVSAAGSAVSQSAEQAKR
ncbi:MAG: entericidin EcnA/B family protein [Brevundimonas sp.]|jgi:entericidin B|uniref:Entericidin A/B family lipoprotein n=1 Tax=Brevundimonas albigilva TaxID=1312364 RepID=A0ABY4SKR3_9CAUL|nr:MULTISPECIES: entericidin A/B family lipoprotein [Brevundimonas]MCV0416149.1 entericidin A/B family lipoprotein [Brevundimonas sp.]PZU59423.1 MAG: entericidin EcnA/B family protein [Brevundimonas sp.]UQV17304.1 entericidin A/B family lipoprotein [Brevundimonas albigilva]URI14864.1 entericidin A/B family lipoprotein [Brevundimonas albigilva]